MTIEEQVLEKLRGLPPDKQREVLEFVDLLKDRDEDGAKTPLRSLRRLWKDLKVDITEKDIAEARREMWGNFPRDISECPRCSILTPRSGTSSTRSSSRGQSMP